MIIICKRILLAWVIISILCCSGCIMQWQRQYLGDPIMNIDYDSQQKNLNDHIYPRREGSSGATGGAGGGCGC